MTPRSERRQHVLRVERQRLLEALAGALSLALLQHDLAVQPMHIGERRIVSQDVLTRRARDPVVTRFECAMCLGDDIAQRDHDHATSSAGRGADERSHGPETHAGSSCPDYRKGEKSRASEGGGPNILSPLWPQCLLVAAGPRSNRREWRPQAGRCARGPTAPRRRPHGESRPRAPGAVVRAALDRSRSNVLVLPAWPWP